MVLSPMGPVLMREFQVGPKELSWLVSAYTFSAAISGLCGTLFVDRFARRSLMLVLLALFGLGQLACAVATDYWVLMGCRMFCGACGGLASGLIQTIVGESISADKRGSAIGTVMTAFSMASVLGVPIGLFSANYFGWHAPFLFFACCVILIAIAVYKTIDPLSNRHVHGLKEFALFEPLIQVLKVPQHWLAYGLVTIMLLASFMVIPFVSIYTVANVKISEKELFIIYLVGGAVSFFASRWVGKMTDRHGISKVFFGLSVLAIPSIYITTHLPAVPLIVVLFTSSIFFVVVSARQIPSATLLNKLADPSLRGTFMSLNSAVQSTVQGVAALIGGYVISRNAKGELLHFGEVGWIAMGFVALSVMWVALITRYLQRGVTKTVSTPV